MRGEEFFFIDFYLMSIGIKEYETSKRRYICSLKPEVPSPKRRPLRMTGPEEHAEL